MFCSSQVTVQTCGEISVLFWHPSLPIRSFPLAWSIFATHFGLRDLDNRVVSETQYSSLFVILTLIAFSFYNFDFAFENSTLLVQVPTPSNPTSTTSPSLSQSCGFLPIPTPCGLCSKSAPLILIGSGSCDLRSSKYQITW